VGLAALAPLIGFADGFAVVIPTFDVGDTMELLPIPDFIPTGASALPALAFAGLASEILVSSSMNDVNTEEFITASAYSSAWV
jgi:hypothetical protein